MNAALEPLRAALAGQQAWLVGGVLRDRLLGRATDDLDLALQGDVAGAARRLSRAIGGPTFPLSQEFGAWRVIAADRSWHVDISPLGADTIEGDLMMRDVTVNAMAEPLAGGGLLDPCGGREDLAARRLRVVSDTALPHDPLRALRIPRLACALGFEVDPATANAVRAISPRLAEMAPERVFAELRQIVSEDAAVSGLRMCDELGLTPVVLPELHALRGVEQNRFHHLDVYEHTLSVLDALIELERDPGATFGERGDDVAAVLAEPLADDLTRGQAARFGALLHDAAKPATRDVTTDGHVTFFHHDREGAALARDVLARLRASERLRSHVSALTRQHLRLGFLVHERPLSPRAVYGYLAACDAVCVDVTVLSVADRLATRGRNADAAIAVHLELARELIDPALEWHAHGAPGPPLRGDELAGALGIEPGPQLGRLLEELTAARFAGEVQTRQEAIEHARAALG